MKTELVFKKFNHDRSLDELRYSANKWTHDLEFIEKELDFTRFLIKTYPFKSLESIRTNSIIH